MNNNGWISVISAVILLATSGCRHEGEWHVGEDKRLDAFRGKEVHPPGEFVRKWQFSEGIEKWVPRGKGIKLAHDPDGGHDQKGCLHVTGRQDKGYNYVWSPRFTVEPGTSYRASMWLRVERTQEDNPPTFFFKVEMTGKEPGNHTRRVSNQVPADKVGKWQKMVLYFSVPEKGLKNVALALEKGGAVLRTLDVSIDDVLLERITDDWDEDVWMDAALRGPITKELRGVHPRLYIDQARLDYLRKAVHNDPRWKSSMDTLIALADAGVRSGPPDYAKQVERGGELDGKAHEQLWQRGVGNRIPHLALAYLLTGEKKYLDSTKAWVFASLDYPTWAVGKMDGLDLAAGHQLAGIGLAYDWLYHDLTETERASIREKLVPLANRLARQGAYEGKAWWKGAYMQNHMWVSLAGMTTTAFALADEVPEAASWIAVAHAKFVKTLEIVGDDGASHEGYGYWEYGAEYIMRYLELVKTCLGIDLYYDSDGQPHPWLSNNAAYALHLALPQDMWTKRSSVVDIGDSPRYHWYGPSYLLRNLARRYPESPWQKTAQWQADAYVKLGCDAPGCGHYLNFAWYDPEILTKSPVDEKLPLVHHFKDIDIASARTSWEGPAAHLVVKCGPPLGHKHVHADRGYGAGHVHPDAGHFVWSAGGKILLRDSGYTKPKATGNHSTVLIDGKGQKGEGGTWFNFSPWLKDKRSPRIRKVEEKDDSVLIDCDVAPAYPVDLGLTTFDRVFSFAGNGDVTVTDSLATETPSQYEWRFQVEGKLEKQGRSWFIRNGDVTARIDIKASVPITVDNDVLAKVKRSYLRIQTKDKVKTAELTTKLAVVL